LKNALERKLHKLVCVGQLHLKSAQREIASDWIEAYKKYVRTRSPAPIVHETKTAPTTTASEVWVNTRSDVWKADRDFGYQICDAGYPNFFDFLAKVGLNAWDDEEGVEQEDEEEA